jgi:hypothetical protein
MGRGLSPPASGIRASTRVARAMIGDFGKNGQKQEFRKQRLLLARHEIELPTHIAN